MKLTKFLLAAALALGCALPAFAADDPSTKTVTPDKMDRTDKKFFEMGAQAGMFEVEAAKVAQSRASAKDVKDFADMMVSDHTAANNQMKELATKKGVTLAATLDDKHAGMVKKLKEADAQKFDKEYVKANVAAHEKAVELFKDTAKDSKDADVKAFASKTTPTLVKHLDMIKALDKAEDKK